MLALVNKMSFYSLVMLFCGSAFAAIPAKKSEQPQPQKILSKSGFVMGGIAGSGFSIRNLTWAQVAEKERVVIDIGDLGGQELRGYPGYYHAELQENPARLILDFSQTSQAYVEEAVIRAKLKDSKRISASRLLLDPTDQTMSLIFDLKKGTKAQVFQVKGQKGTSRVVVDFQ